LWVAGLLHVSALPTFYGLIAEAERSRNFKENTSYMVKFRLRVSRIQYSQRNNTSLCLCVYDV